VEIHLTLFRGKGVLLIFLTNFPVDSSEFQFLLFELPLGSLIPRRLKNLIAASKNIGTTHITNGCYRLHPVEWNIGEVAGFLAAEAIEKSETVSAIRENSKSLISFQKRIQKAGIEIRWSQLEN
jgi:hypothetical protein